MSQDELIQTLKEMDVDQKEIDEIVQHNKDAELYKDMPDVQPGNVLIVHLFSKVSRYWDRIGMDATPCNLDPLKVEARASKFIWYRHLDELAIEMLWEGLDILEKAYLSAWMQHKKTHE